MTTEGMSEHERATEGNQSRTKTGQQPQGTRGKVFSKTQIGYWLKKGKLKTRSSTDWQIRLAHQTREEWFNLHTSDRQEAAGKARDLYLFLVANGWEKTLATYKPKAAPIQKSDKVSVAQFGDLFRGMLRGVEKAPSSRTITKYLDALDRVCRKLGTDDVLSLTPGLVAKFKDKYLADAEKAGRDPEKARNSVNSTIQDAAAPFAKKRLRQWANSDLTKAYQITNPFEFVERAKVDIKDYKPLSREIIDSIWRDATLLRDGDSTAQAPKRNKGGRPKKGVKPLPKERLAKRHHHDLDWRIPRPVSYAVLLLELGCGLRRIEADRARKDWIVTDTNGRRFIHVSQTPDFKPKSKHNRYIPMQDAVWNAIKPIMDSHVSPMLLPGGLPVKHPPGREPKRPDYRLDKEHRALVDWLRMHGVNNQTPCHTLRKEFGSYVATSFGLFFAQKYLGHSDPKVTERHYAGLTADQPQLQNVKIIA